MPFTFSHPALVLPLSYLPKRYYSLTELVIGSLTPDFEYYIRMELKGNFSHSLLGLFLFDLPIGILLAFLFHNIIRNNLFKNLPMFFKSRFLFFSSFNWNQYFIKNWFVVVVSVLVGAFSHLFWDSFTHHDGFFVNKINALQQSIYFLNQNIPVFKILQHSSTLFGGFILAFSILKMPILIIEENTIDIKYWSIFFAITIITILLRFFSELELMKFGNVIITIITASIISFIVTPLIIKKY
jgi:hypothetical protein